VSLATNSHHLELIATHSFGAYDAIKKRLASPSDLGHAPPLWKLFTAGSIAGLLGGLAGNPADIILVRMISDSAKPDAQRFKYRQAFDGLFRIRREEGSRALFRGLGPNSIRSILMNCSQLGSYDIFKDLLLHSTSLHDGMPLHFLTSVLSGTVATTVCAPFDVLKSRIMSSSTQDSVRPLLPS
jgi:dicarboxylate transporter 10